MATKTCKDIPDFYEQQEQLWEDLAQRISQFAVPDLDYPPQLAIDDALSFMEIYFCTRRLPLCVQTYCSENSVTLKWIGDNFDYEINFFGFGSWSYTFIKYPYKETKQVIEFDGKGHSWKSCRDGTLHWVFSLSKEAEEMLALKDEFLHTYEPLLKLNTRGRHDSDKVFIEWSEHYWDGPITGWCSYKNRLYYFKQVDETNYSRDRMYAVYDLGIFQSKRAAINHKSFRFWVDDGWLRKVRWSIGLVLWYGWNKFWSDFWLNLRYGHDYTKQRDAEQKWLDKHPIIGYFEY